MNRQLLRMKYHPAKKEIEFRRFQNGKEIPIRSDSVLRTKYMNRKGTFVLQDYGNELFDDIAKAFDGLETIDVEAVTTKMDYEDFAQMVEYYNEEGKCRINATLLAELPDMNETYKRAVEYGRKSIGILEYHRGELFAIPLENEKVKQSAENYANQIQEKIEDIEEKIENLKDNRVNLCFTGVFSSGKSALINALLGYRILPENIRSETAKMFRIVSPEKGENVRICFDITNVHTVLEWNAAWNCFEVAKGPYESDALTELQNIINTAKMEGLRQHEQIEKLLRSINASQTVSSTSEIVVYFPVALDNETVRFTIYDTPGTDSNYLEHQKVLTNALEKQMQSILIFVCKPNGIEGQGNNALLSYLKEAEKKDVKTSIDIARSLFVINWADSVSADQRRVLQNEKIRYNNDDPFSIKLSDKKLFFTSAAYAYAAKAIKNGIASETDKSMAGIGKAIFATEGSPFGFCYRQDRCATSEIATKKLLGRCESALQSASGDEGETLLISSGLYALESEIIHYGEKFASAVRAFAIIDSVDKTLANLTNVTNSLRESNSQEIGQIETNISELDKTIREAIVHEYQNTVIPAGEALPAEVRKKLGIDSGSLHKQFAGTRREIDEQLKGRFFGYGKVRFREGDKDRIQKKIDGVLEAFTRNFLAERKKLLEGQRDAFMNGIKNAIARNGNISDAAKRLFLDIPEPNITEPAVRNVGSIYDAHRRTTQFLWIRDVYLDKSGFLENIEENFIKIAVQMNDDYGKEYQCSLETLSMQIKSLFEANLAKFSLSMRALLESREAMLGLGDRIEAAAKALGECREKLDEMIWMEVENG